MKRVFSRAPFAAPVNVAFHNTLESAKVGRKQKCAIFTLQKKSTGGAEKIRSGEVMAMYQDRFQRLLYNMYFDGTASGYRSALHKAIAIARQKKMTSVSVTTKWSQDAVRGIKHFCDTDGGEVLPFAAVAEAAGKKVKRDRFKPRRVPLSADIGMFAAELTYVYERLKTAPAANESGEVKGPKARKGKKAVVADSGLRNVHLDFTVLPPPSSRIDSSRWFALGKAVGDAVNDARNLGNLREDEGTPQFYSDWMKHYVCGASKNTRLVAHLQGDELLRAGLRLFHGVGRAAVHPPVLSIVEHRGNPKMKSSIALVGKGVTFDSGGMNVKPFGNMETMHMDMMGAAAVMATMRAVARLNLPINVVGVVGLAENAIGPTALQPSSIITSLKGTTVEITNTDAEGRLVLADCLTYVQNHAKLRHKPKTIIDLATLTGAMLVALGSTRAGAFGNDAKLMEDLYKCGQEVGDLIWPMPIGREHIKAMKGMHSDLINCSSSREAGSCTAAAFLKHFVEKDVQWAHLDIAGPGMGGKAKGFNPDGAPGFAVKLLMRYLINQVLNNRGHGLLLANAAKLK